MPMEIACIWANINGASSKTSHKLGDFQVRQFIHLSRDDSCLCTWTSTNSSALQLHYLPFTTLFLLQFCANQTSGMQELNELQNTRLSFIATNIMNHVASWKATWDFEDACWTTFLDPLAAAWWLARSARMLSKDHSTKDPSASEDRFPIQSTDVL